MSLSLKSSEEHISTVNSETTYQTEKIVIFITSPIGTCAKDLTFELILILFPTK